MNIRKISLIETIAACFIISVVFSIFFSSLFRLISSNNFVSLSEKEIIENILVDVKIRDIIESIAPPFHKNSSSGSLRDEEKTVWSTIHTDINGQELFFVSRPKQVHNFSFSNYVSGTLRVNEGDLVLTVYPFWFFQNNSEDFSLDSFIIMKEVEKISFEFYIVDSNNLYGRVSEKIFSGSFDFPRMIKLIVNKKDGSILKFFFTMYANPFFFIIE